MDRKELLYKLLMAKPALSTNEIIPALSHYWFTGEHVMAYNNKIAISVPCKTGFAGAVPGNMLVNLLKASKANDVELSVSKNSLLIKAASANGKIGMLPPEAFLFEMPEFKSDRKLPVKGAEFLSCLDACMRSVDEDTSAPERLGVTLVAERNTLSFYATDDKTLSFAYTPLREMGGIPRVILSAPFCKQLLALADPEASIQLEIAEDHVLYKTGNGVMLHGALIETDCPLDFEGMVEHHYPSGSEDRLLPVPAKMKLILDRAVVFTGRVAAPGWTEVTVGKDHMMRFASKSGLGEIYDVVQVPGHPEVAVTVDPRLIKRVYGHYDYMLFTEQAVIMAKGSTMYAISAGV